MFIRAVVARIHMQAYVQLSRSTTTRLVPNPPLTLRAGTLFLPPGRALGNAWTHCGHQKPELRSGTLSLHRRVSCCQQRAAPTLIFIMESSMLQQPATRTASKSSREPFVVITRDKFGLQQRAAATASKCPLPPAASQAEIAEIASKCPPVTRFLPVYGRVFSGSSVSTFPLCLHLTLEPLQRGRMGARR